MNKKDKMLLGIMEDEIRKIRLEVNTLKRLVYELMDEVRSLD
jgi:hypothetical protein